MDLHEKRLSLAAGYPKGWHYGETDGMSESELERTRDK